MADTERSQPQTARSNVELVQKTNEASDQKGGKVDAPPAEQIKPSQQNTGPQRKKSMKDIVMELNNSEDYFVVDDVMREFNQKKSCWEGVKSYAFLVWDGLGFWGTDVTKLDRLKRGKYMRKPGWLDRFKSAEYCVTSVIFLYLAISIILYEGNRVGKPFQQSMELVKRETLSYPANSQLNLMTTFYLNKDKLVERINEENSAFGTTKPIPTDFNEMTDDNKQKIEKYVCDYTSFSMHSLFSDERLGHAFTYNITQFDSNCNMMLKWANDKLRFQRYLSMGSRTDNVTGTKYIVDDKNYNDNVEAMILKYPDIDKKKTGLTNFTLDHVVNYNGRLQVLFHKKLYGLKAEVTTDTYKNQSKSLYSDWTFKDYNEWNNYWYSRDRQQLSQTPEFEIGDQAYVHAQLTANSKRTIDINGEIVVTIFGFGIKFQDKEKVHLDYHSITDVDEDGNIKMKYLGTSKTPLTTNRFFLNLAVDYHEQDTITKYYTGADFISKVGGYSASMNAIWSYIAPFFLLYFLYNLALVIKNGKKLDYKADLIGKTVRFNTLFNEYKQGYINIKGNEAIQFDKPLWSHDEYHMVKKIERAEISKESLDEKNLDKIHDVLNDICKLFSSKLEQSQQDQDSNKCQIQGCCDNLEEQPVQVESMKVSFEADFQKIEVDHKEVEVKIPKAALESCMTYVPDRTVTNVIGEASQIFIKPSPLNSAKNSEKDSESDAQSQHQDQQYSSSNKPSFVQIQTIPENRVYQKLVKSTLNTLNRQLKREQARLSVLDTEQSMNLVDIIVHLRKQVGFYRLYLAMDKVTHQQQTNHFTASKIDNQTIQIADLAKQVQLQQEIINQMVTKINSK